MQTILIVDDEPNIVEGLASQLQQNYGDRAIVLRAYSGTHALSILRENQFGSAGDIPPAAVSDGQAGCQYRPFPPAQQRAVFAIPEGDTFPRRVIGKDPIPGPASIQVIHAPPESRPESIWDALRGRREN